MTGKHQHCINPVRYLVSLLSIVYLMCRKHLQYQPNIYFNVYLGALSSFYRVTRFYSLLCITRYLNLGFFDFNIDILVELDHLIVA